MHLVGELDLYNAPEIRAALLELCSEQPERLVVDLGEVDFVDSTALGVLIEARTKLENRQSFLLASPGLETHRALSISGLDRHLAVHDRVESALAAELNESRPPWTLPCSRSSAGSSPSESRSSSYARRTSHRPALLDRADEDVLGRVLERDELDQLRAVARSSSSCARSASVTSAANAPSRARAEERGEQLAPDLPVGLLLAARTARITSASQRTACASASSVAVSQACRLTTRSTFSPASKPAMSPRSKRSPAAPERSASAEQAAITSSFRSSPTSSTSRPRSR